MQPSKSWSSDWRQNSQQRLMEQKQFHYEDNIIIIFAKFTFMSYCQRAQACSLPLFHPDQADWRAAVQWDGCLFTTRVGNLLTEPPVLLGRATGRYLTQTNLYMNQHCISYLTFFAVCFWQWYGRSLRVRLYLYVRVTATEPWADTAFFRSFLLDIFHARTLSSFKSKLKTDRGTFYHIKFKITYSYLELHCSCAVAVIQSFSFSFSLKEGSYIFQVCLKAILRWIDAQHWWFKGCCNHSSCPNLIHTLGLSLWSRCLHKLFIFQWSFIITTMKGFFIHYVSRCDCRLNLYLLLPWL